MRYKFAYCLPFSDRVERSPLSSVGRDVSSRWLCSMRELRKSEQADVINDVISHALFPHEPGLRLAFEKIAGYVMFIRVDTYHCG